MALPTQWTWVWVNSGSWWWAGRPGVLWFMGSQRVGHNGVTELNWLLIHFAIQQKLTQHCKSTIYQLKINFKNQLTHTYSLLLHFLASIDKELFTKLRDGDKVVLLVLRGGPTPSWFPICSYRFLLSFPPCSGTQAGALLESLPW